MIANINWQNKRNVAIFPGRLRLSIIDCSVKIALLLKTIK